MTTEITFWQCPDCRKQGSVYFDGDQPAIDTIAVVLADHRETSPDCDVLWTDLQIELPEGR